MIARVIVIARLRPRIHIALLPFFRHFLPTSGRVVGAAIETIKWQNGRGLPPPSPFSLFVHPVLTLFFARALARSFLRSCFRHIFILSVCTFLFIEVHPIELIAASRAAVTHTYIHIRIFLALAIPLADWLAERGGTLSAKKSVRAGFALLFRDV